MGKINRSSKSGKFVPRGYMKENPDSTTEETVESVRVSAGIREIFAEAFDPETGIIELEGAFKENEIAAILKLMRAEKK